MHCEINRVVLNNEFGRKFLAFGEWFHNGNDKTPLGIYDQPSVMPVPVLMQAVLVLEVTASALVQNALMVKVAIQAMETAVQCEDTPHTASNDNLVRSRISAGNTMGKVSSLTRLLEHSLKDGCRASSASKSLSHIDTLLVGASTEIVPETEIGHLVGPHTHNNP